MRSEQAKREDEPVTAERLGHRPGLDGLRGLAVILVMLAHFSVPGLGGGGLVGVTLFFVLSGFLITTLLVEEDQRSGRIDLAQFYLRRARRLFPALAVVLAVSAFWMPWSDLQPVALYYGNWARMSEPGALGFLGHTWSLAIEEQFYLAWPLVVLFLPRQAKRVAAVGIGVAIVLRLLIWQGAGDTNLVHVSTFTRIDAIFAGCLLALTSWRPRVLWPAVGGLLVLSTVSSEAFTFRVGLPAITLLSVVAVSAAAAKPGVPVHPVLGWFGRRSYALYLWHGVFVFGLRPDGIVDRTGLAIASLVAAEVSWQAVERWFVKRQRPTARRSDSTDDASRSLSSLAYTITTLPSGRSAI